MEQSCRWFKNKYKVTPATSFTVSKDLEGSDLKTAWYNSRFYRINMLWENGSLRIRDIHLFDEKFPSVYETQVATSNECTFFTLPVVDGYIWSKPGQIAGLRFKVLQDGNETLLKGGNPEFTNKPNGTLHVRWPLTNVEGALEFDFTEKQVKINFVGKTAYNWYLDLNTAEKAVLPFEKISPAQIDCRFEKTNYKLKAIQGSFSKPANGAVLRLKPKTDKIILNLADVTGL
jgi:hypothetical protein